MNINTTQRLSRNSKKIYYTLEWGKAVGQRISTGVFTYVKPKDQIQRNHNKEALIILEAKRSQMILERQAISIGYIPRLSKPRKVDGEVTYIIDRIKKEMGGTPETALENFYNNSPYSFSDTTQRAIKSLIKTPIMIISEPDINWWLSQRGVMIIPI